MYAQLKNPRVYVIVLTEAVIFAIAFLGAHLIRFEFMIASVNFGLIAPLLLWIVPLKVVTFFSFGLYKGMWRYASVRDFWRLVEASVLSTIFLFFVVRLVYNFVGFSRAAFLLDGILTCVMTGGVRMAIRSYYSITSSGVLHRESGRQARKRVLIIGAGRSGEKIVREIFDNPLLDFQAVGFLDDAADKKGRAVHGVPVFGSVDYLPKVLEKHAVDQVFISIPSATGFEMRRIIETCKDCGVSHRTLPAIGQLLGNGVSVKALRDVNYEDLLRRAPISLDMAGIQEYISGRTVLVTGAGGSIGSELCRQMIRFQPAKLVLADSSEANLYGIQMELHHELHFNAYHTVLSRVQDRTIMESVFRTYRPSIIFHAAAYKHVPMLERNPWEAIFNNVIGSRVAMEMAEEFGAKRFVLVSTDKAVRPVSVMGASKGLAELILQSFQGGETRFMAVRFGNVIASSGSVIPLFRRQIEHGGPVTVTHPDMTRYFMTIPEASQLILQAGALGEGREIFVLEMGTPIRIADMAVDLIRLSGKEPGRDIEIVFTGLRPGEKLCEELITQVEDAVSTRHEKIMALSYNGKWNWNGLSSRQRFRKWLDSEIQELCAIAETHDAVAIKQKLKRMLPEYTPEKTECVLDDTANFDAAVRGYGN